ncbi:MAG: hypothetical protein IJ880_00560 [Bacilli bacterium]|nr:hypothetical protein [Bacilli bacterium]
MSLNFLYNLSNDISKKQKTLLLDYLKGNEIPDLVQSRYFTEKFKNTLSDITFPVSFDKVLTREINEKKEDNTFNLIDLDLLALTYNTIELNKIINNNEIIRKDDVNTYNNIKSGKLTNFSLSSVNNKAIYYDNSKIELIPSVLLEYNINNIEVDFFPKKYTYLKGNNLTKENVKDNDQFWMVQLYNDINAKTGADITITFSNSVNFNNLMLNYFGKYRPEIESIQIFENNEFKDVNFNVDIDKKNLIIYFENPENGEHQSYYTNKIKIRLVQSRYDFVWKAEVDNENEILKGEYTSLDAINEYIYENKTELNEKRILRNQYTYTFGLFYIKVLYKSYNAKKVDTITLNGFINNEDDVILGTLEVSTLLEENKQPLEVSSNNDILSPLQIVTSIERGE